MLYERNCPLCNKNLYYTIKGNKKAADKKKTICRSCSSIIKNKKYGNNKKFIEQYATKGKGCGKDNPFYGKNHTDETKNKLRQVDRSYTQTKKFREQKSKDNAGKKNPMYGKTVYGVWEEKYGKEEADKRMNIAKKKWSISSSGENNPMYGKPAPQGSGNGWSGWYKGWFFRSLKELSYMINEIEEKKKRWRTAETKDLKIRYIDYKGSQRTYTADFIVEEKYLIEVKPEKLKSSITVRLKQNAAQQFCQEKGLIYLIEDAKILPKEDIKKLHDERKIKFTDRYERMYNERYNNN